MGRSIFSNGHKYNLYLPIRINYEGISTGTSTKMFSASLLISIEFLCLFFLFFFIEMKKRSDGEYRRKICPALPPFDGMEKKFVQKEPGKLIKGTNYENYYEVQYLYL